MGGLPSDKQGGIADLQTTAADGHYLAPFAPILLSIAYVREKDKPRALELLTGKRSFFAADFTSSSGALIPGCFLANILRSSSEISTYGSPGAFIRNSPVCNRPVTLRR